MTVRKKHPVVQTCDFFVFKSIGFYWHAWDWIQKDTAVFFSQTGAKKNIIIYKWVVLHWFQTILYHFIANIPMWLFHFTSTL